MFQKFGDLLSKVILLVFLSIGCTTIHYQSNETIPVLWGSQKELTDETKVVLGKKDFYLWGLYPKSQSVFLDDEFKKVGFQKVNKTVIEEFHGMVAFRQFTELQQSVSRSCHSKKLI